MGTSRTDRDEDALAVEAPVSLAAGIIVVGHVIALGILPGNSLLWTTVLEGGILLALVTGAIAFGLDLDVVGLGAAGYIGAVVVAWLLARTYSPLLAAGALVSLVSVAMYGIHRYERVVLGLVEEPA